MQRRPGYPSVTVYPPHAGHEQGHHPGYQQPPQMQPYPVMPSMSGVAKAARLVSTLVTQTVFLTILVALGVVYPIMYAPEAAFFAGLFPPRVRYTGISAVYQISGIVASGLTPLLLTWLLAVRGGGTSLIIAYFLLTGLISVVSTLAIRSPEHEQTGG